MSLQNTEFNFDVNATALASECGDFRYKALYSRVDMQIRHIPHYWTEWVIIADGMGLMFGTVQDSFNRVQTFG